MASLILNANYKVRLAVQKDEQTAFNVRYYQCTAVTGTGSSEAAAVLLFGATIGITLRNCMSDQVTFKGVGIQKIFPLPPTVEVIDRASAGVGGEASDCLPRQVSGLITLTTANAGRKYRGRQYVPFPAEGDNTAAGRPTAGYKTLLDAHGAQLILARVLGAGGNTATLTPVLIHRDGSTPSVITGFTSRTSWATQRRRGDYGKPNPSPF